jgi:hypothetical protein
MVKSVEHIGHRVYWSTARRTGKSGGISARLARGVSSITELLREISYILCANTEYFQIAISRSFYMSSRATHHVTGACTAIGKDRLQILIIGGSRASCVASLT